MTIGCWISVIIGGVLLLCGLVAGISLLISENTGEGVGTLIIAFIIGVVLIAVPIIYSNTNSGKRALKDQKSDFGTNEEQREVVVYDINGNVIKKYGGKFDIETDHDKYILFDDENNKRHIIYYTTGTVIIDEK